MAKRISTGQSNTLFNYFESPKRKRETEQNADSKPKTNLKFEEASISNDDDEVIQQSQKKRSRKSIIDSDTDDDETPKPKQKDKKAKIQNSSSEEEEKVGLRSFSYDKTLNNSITQKENSEKKIESVSVDSSLNNNNTGFGDDQNWVHNTLDFLKPNKIRDINKNRPDHPEYNSKTLYVPPDYLVKLTPVMRQWWILKSKHFDSVLFFKVGKFYELYHMDAVIGVNNLGFSYMKGDFAHSGFPESAYGRMASSLIEQGFKVARVEQTETPEMMTERCKAKKSTKFDKVVNREICQISTQATCVYGAQLTNAKHPLPYYMLALAEKPITGGSRFGVCFVDTSTGNFHLGEFDDDKHCSRLLALLAQHFIALLLTERGNVQPSTIALFQKTLGNVQRDSLIPKKQFYSAQGTIDALMNGCYFKDKNDDFHWPSVLSDLIKDGTPKSQYELALKALGACVWYLKDSELDIQLLCMKKFNLYNPVDVGPDSKITRDFMILDAVTIENLSLLGSAGTLEKTLDYCTTAFGKRLLHQWICRPLCVVESIVERQKAVKELYTRNDVRSLVRSILSELPDLERQVSKIHTFGNKFCSQMHPDSRATFYEAKTYSKRKILDLITTMRGFEKAQEIVGTFEGCSSMLLEKLSHRPPQGKFVDLTSILQYFREAFDQDQAKADGKIIPQQGIDEEYDQAEEEIKDIQNEATSYLKEIQNLFNCKLSYFGTDKKRFQIEVPENRTHKVTSEYQLESTRKGSKPCKRYSTPATRTILANIIKAETKRNKIIQDLNRRIFEKFSEHRETWEEVIQCLMMLDVLCAFAEYARVGPQTVCFPKINSFRNEPFVNIENGVHPCTLLEDFVPNSIKLDTDDNAKLMLLTGPNMGGKSTLMRQVALIIIMAQMGCAVPASDCEISLVDRIFTRLGANDDILQGQSTFLVELSEAAAILRHATKNSFVLLDELGRGTSTHDGNAIATAYLKQLVEIQCRTIFSTHYHSLVEFYSRTKGIQLAHMACMSEENNDDPLSSVTLLYKLREGNCPQSYGFNAAKLAGLPRSIIERAYKVATELETTTKLRKLFHNLLLSEDPLSIRNQLKSLKV